QLGLVTAAVQQAPSRATLRLPGTLLLDPSSLVRVRARFAGEVIAVSSLGAAEDGRRLLRPGDRVRKHQLLASIWSKDLGEKKSELVDALTRLWLDQEALRQLQDLQKKAAAPERSVREAERNVRADQITVERIRRTLRSWRLADDEIEAVELEA